MLATRTAPVRPLTFREILTAAVADFATKGYDSERRLQEWLRELHAAAEREMVPASVAEYEMREALRAIYRRLVEDRGLLKANPGAGRFTLDRVAPRLRAELDRRILASASLIKLNRERAVRDTLQRFAGWATSIPPGGSETVDRREVKSSIGKRLQSMKYRDRVLNIDQGHKFASNLSDIFAKDGGAVAGKWRQHYTRNPREEHRRRDGKIYLIRDSWAHERGLVKPGPNGYTDEITAPGEEIMCRCSYEFYFGLSQIPVEMLTRKGKDELTRVRDLLDERRKVA